LKRFLSDARSETTALSTILKVGFTQEGTKTIQELFGQKVIQFPKPLSLLTHLIAQSTNDDDLIVDFFAGSGTTAHAMLELNRSDGQRRRFVCVQLPEEVPDGELPNIAEIGKERIRRVIRRMSKEAKSKPNEDLGFRVYKLDRSNFRAWQDYAGSDLRELESLFAQAETPLANEWTSARLLPEVMLLEGFPLDSAVTEKRPERRQRAFFVESPDVGHRLLACFDEQVDDSVLAELGLREDDVLVCLDSALTDRAKMRLADRCTLRTI
jgi:adenine-specific DNA-methyltransferase